MTFMELSLVKLLYTVDRMKELEKFKNNVES